MTLELVGAVLLLVIILGAVVTASYYERDFLLTMVSGSRQSAEPMHEDERLRR